MESAILIHFAFPKHFSHVHSGIPLQGYFHRLFIFIIYLQGNRCGSYCPAGKDNLLLFSDYRFPIYKKLRFSLFSHKIRGFHLIPEETLLSVNSVHLKFFVILQILRQGNQYLHPFASWIFRLHSPHKSGHHSNQVCLRRKADTIQITLYICFL